MFVFYVIYSFGKKKTKMCAGVMDFVRKLVSSDGFLHEI